MKGFLILLAVLILLPILGMTERYMPSIERWYNMIDGDTVYSSDGVAIAIMRVDTVHTKMTYGDSVQYHFGPWEERRIVPCGITSVKIEEVKWEVIE